MLECKNISKSFDENEKHIFQEANLTLHPGKIHCLMGENGSGKTTLFNIITGYTKLSSGEIYFKSKDISKTRPHRINQMGVSRSFQDLRLADKLTVKENLAIVLLTRKEKPTKEAMESNIRAVASEIGLSEYLDFYPSNLSYGQRKLLTLGCIIASEPKVMLLDEPMSGLNTTLIQKVTDLLKHEKSQGKTILLIEHNTDFVEAVGDIFVLIKDRKMYMDESLEKIINMYN